ncbi:MAG: NAD(P)H-dependent oxidoreductase [bacterium]|nr:NAD(P)H-dependent oxidoreductase [bacterium]
MIAILSGSARKNSNTLKVAKAIKNTISELSPEELVHIVDFNGYDIPSINKGFMNPNALSEWQSELFNAMSEASLIFILTPEYNWFPSAEIIQMIHTFGDTPYASAWQDKVFVTCGVSNGRGGRMPAVQLGYAINKIISVFNYESMVSAKMFESQFTPKVIDENGHSLGSEEYDKGMKAFVSYNLHLNNKLKK